MINERRYGASKGKKNGEDCQYEESGRFIVLPPYSLNHKQEPSLPGAVLTTFT